MIDVFQYVEAMRPSLSLSLLSLATLGSVVLAPAALAGRRPITRNADSTKFNAATSTTVDFMNKRVWLPGIWRTTSTADSVTFTKGNEKPVVVTLTSVANDQCYYQTVRQQLLKTWGAKTITQEQARIEYLILGTSKYRGLKWVMPTENGRIKHWCIPQDGKLSVDIGAPLTETDLVKFIEGNFILQFAVRRSR